MTGDVITGPYSDNAQRYARGGHRVQTEVDGAVPADRNQGIRTAVAVEGAVALPRDSS